MSLPPPLAPHHALFLDFDGTLVEIAPTPDSVQVAEGLIDTLTALQGRLEGALALVSGRPLAQIDHFLSPLRLPGAGVHGAERRGIDGQLRQRAWPSLDGVLRAAQALADAHPGVRVERKGAAVAVHYRQAPDAALACVSAMEAAARATPGLHLLAGKMVVEVLPDGVGKGHAVRSFMAEAPFAERVPVFIGDDVTDEAGIAEVQSTSGFGVKVGPGESQAQYRLPSVGAVREWLQSTLARHA